MKIHSLKTERKDSQIVICASYNKNNSEQDHTLWYSFPQEYEQYVVTEQYDAFFVALFYEAMLLNEDIYIEGALSEKLFYNFKNIVRELAFNQNENLTKVKVFAKELSNSNLCKEGGCVAGFSGGVDSFCTLISNYFSKNVPRNHRISHLLFSNVGNEDTYESKKVQFAKLKEIPIGLPYIWSSSNLFEHLHLPFETTCIVRNVSVVMHLQKLFSKYYFASAYYINQKFVGTAYHDSIVQPLLVSALSTESTDCIIHGSQYTRLEKTVRITECDLSFKYIDVCTSTDRGRVNCGKCFKCLRTLFTLELLGKLELYKDIFDLNNYSKYRTMYLAEIIKSDEIFSKELTEYAKSINFNFPFKSRLFSNRFLLKIYKIVRKLYYFLRNK